MVLWNRLLIWELSDLGNSILGYVILVSLSFYHLFFHDKGRLHMVKLSSSQHLPFIIMCVKFCVCLRLLFCLHLWLFYRFENNVYFTYISPCAFTSFCVILFSSSFSFVWSILPSSPQSNQKTETPFKKNNSMNGLTKQNQYINKTKQNKWTKTLHLLQIQPTNQNPRAHLRKSSAIAPAPPTSW